MKTIRFGIIGCGLMGREFASAAARWCHLPEMTARPEIIALCSKSPATFEWYKENFPSVAQCTHDYRDVLANPDVDAVYVALPHNLHREVYCAAIEAGKHLLGEKPFGMTRADCDAIVATARAHSNVLVRCSSQSLFFPAVQRMAQMLEKDAFGRIIQVQTGLLHSSDLDPNKPINWKRMIEFNGEYGVMGDLGLHACHLGFRAGWVPQNVRALLSDIVKDRPDGKGGRAPCETWDNAIMLCETTAGNGERFPWTMRLERIAPGEKNNWYIKIYGTRASARWSSAHSDLLEVLTYDGGEQAWTQIQTGHDTAFKSITGSIFQFGFSDAILQMWAAFIHELSQGRPLKKYASCLTPEEAALGHNLFTAALESQKNSSVVAVS